MQKHNALDSIPKNWYYLVQIIQHADFETEQIEKILFVSENKQDLMDLYNKNNWDSWEYYDKLNKK